MVNTYEGVDKNVFKNKFMDLVKYNLSLFNEVNSVMYKRSKKRLSYHILTTRITNTIKGLEQKPMCVIINKSRVFLDSNSTTLNALVTQLTHFIFKTQSSPLMVNDSKFQENDVKDMFNNCSEMISILTILWYHYFTTDVKCFIEDIKINS